MITEHLLSALKRALKDNNVSYRQAGNALGLSESSIKRLFAEQGFTLPRLETLCELANIDLAILIQRAESMRLQVDQLSTKQEQDIVDDPALLLLCVCVFNHCDFREILDKYQFTEPELTQLFVRLDRLNILELLPGNRYHLKVSPHFVWQPNGPIQRFFIQSFIGEYLASNLSDQSNHLHFVWGMLTPESARELNKKVHRLIDDYTQTAQQESTLAMADKLTSSMMILFREDWEPERFKALLGAGIPPS